jgi:hypothetical protein
MGHGKMKITKEEAIKYIEDFLAGKGGAWDWDEFISVPIDDLDLNRSRLICARLPETHPPIAKTEYCNEEGRQVLREIANQLRLTTE